MSGIQKSASNLPIAKRTRGEKWLWAMLALSSITIVTVVLGLTELVETIYFRDAGQIPAFRHYFFIARGVVSSLLLAFWAAWYVLRQRKAHEEELRRSREHYRGLLEASPNAIVLYDGNLCVYECNAATEQLYGYTKPEIVGKYLPTVPDNRLGETGKLIQQVRGGQSVLDIETKRQSKQGTLLDVQLSLLPYRNSGQNYFLEITGDIRDRVHLRETLVHVEKLTSMGQMAAGTAHHLNTPLASVLLRLRMMREGKFEGSLNDDLRRVEENLQFCQRFVRRLLEFSSRAPSRKQPETIGSTIDGVVGLLRPELLTKRIGLSLELGPVAAEKVFADPNQLEAVFLILLTNAIDASEPGGNIAVQGESKSPQQIELQISDQGCGIHDKVLPHIFEPFFTTKPVGKGTGLGLAIAHNIVREHSGTIRIESIPGIGTTAFLELPVYQEPVSESRGVLA